MEHQGSGGIRDAVSGAVDNRFTDSRSKHRKALRLGYVPMTDCAPLVVALELGYFRKYGLEIELVAEPGWATIREKISHGELDAAQAPASMALELSFGYGSAPLRCLTGFVTAHNGNAITLSNELWNRGIRDGASLAAAIKRNPSERFTFAGVLKYSSQNYLMRRWLLAHGIVPERDVDMAIVAPPQVHDCLRYGYLDGYCVAEPWSSVGLLKGIGWCATLTSDFDPMHPEKVFMVTEAFHEEEPERHLSLLRALWDAAVYCDQSSNRADLARLLSEHRYVDVPATVLENALVGPFQLGMERETSARDAIIFHRGDANRPSLAKAEWVLDEIETHGLQGNFMRPSEERLRECFREDIFEEMLRLVRPEVACQEVGASVWPAP